MITIRPSLLKKGDKIAIVAPAGNVLLDNITWAKNWIEQKGYEVILGKHFASKDNYFAGTLKERAKDFQQFLDDPSVRAIFCARGGYGSVHIIDTLSFKKFRNNPKWVVGFSDITVFLNHIYNNYGIQTIHGPMPNSFKTTSLEALDYLFTLLTKGKTSYVIPKQPFHKNQQVEGILTGGNLSILNSLAGSKSFSKNKNTILFIEDIGEYQYHIDRMLHMLKRGGYLKNIRSLLVGAFTDMKDTMPPFGQSMEEMILDIVKEYGFPVYFNIPSGHIKHNLPLIIGGKITISNQKICVQ